MAPVFNVLRTCGFIVYLILHVHASQNNLSDPWILSVEVKEKSCVQNICKYLLNVRGGEFLGHSSWRLTPVEASRGSSCDVWTPSYDLREIETVQWETKVEISVPSGDEKIYFCLRHNEKKNSPFGGKWVHQGGDLFLEPKNNVSQSNENSQTTTNLPIPSQKSNLEEFDAKWTDLSHDTDINNLPTVPRLTRDETKDIEILIKDKYIPLSNMDPRDVENVLRDGKNSGKTSVNSYKDGDDSYTDGGNRRESGFRNVKEVEEVVKDGDSYKDVQLVVTDGNNVQIFNDRFALDESEIQRDTLFSNGISTNLDNNRIKRETTENATSDDLISNEDTIKAKDELENSVKRVVVEENQEDSFIIRKERQVTSDDVASGNTEAVMVKIEGFRVEDSGKEPKIIEESIPSVLADSRVVLRLFGDGLTERTMIAFTYDAKKYGEQCKFLVNGEYLVKEGTLERRTALFEITAPPPGISASKLYICAKNLKPGVKDAFKDEDSYIHQGTEKFKILATHNALLPLWVALILILVCLTFSALFSGLNLGLMSLDRTELKIISNTGTEQERKYARAIMPVRDHGNYLLCSILLGNVAVNSTFTILLDELTSGLFAVIFSTLSIVLLGEITPQAICSRHGLMVGAKSIMITKAVMALTAPLAFPVSKLLDYFLGEEIGNVYNRERLKELVKLTTDVNDLDKDEVNIISGALELRKKSVSDVMTKLEDVFMLPITSVLDFETMSEIVKSGYSRIPVFEGHRGNIVTVLFIKDLAFVDPDDNTPLRTLCQYYQNPCNFVFEDVTLDVMFRQFKDGHKGHMAFVHRINNEGEGDPFYETIGLVTLEDVIEEMIQAEIVDETDVFMDNRTKRRRNRPLNKLQDFAAFAERHEHQRIHISPQLTLATFQFLSTSVDAFRPDAVSEIVLRRLLRQDVIQHIKLKGKTRKDPSTFVFQQAKPVDYFVLILEGRVEVTVGRENLVFEAGPFTYFGVQALTQNVGVAESPTPSAMGSLQNINMDSMLRYTFVPDYSVRAITEVFYLTVKRSLYLAAKRATLMEKGALSKGTNEQFDTEVDKHLGVASDADIPTSLISKKLLGNTSSASTKDGLQSTSTDNKLLQAVDEDISLSGEHKTPSRQVSPNPMPVSASPHTRSSFASRQSPVSEPRNGDLYASARQDEQEKLLKSP